jgi:hypothetical protein
MTMPEKPLLLSTPLIGPTMDGRKTQTRRVFRGELGRERANALTLLQVRPDLYPNAQWEWDESGIGGLHYGDATGAGVVLMPKRCPYAPGGLLWVREAWCAADRWLGREHDDPTAIRYRADDTCLSFENAPPDAPVPFDTHQWGPAKWRPSIHMPKWAARIWLRVTEVRVERVQAITEADAKAEGVALGGSPHPDVPPADTHRAAFADLWDKLNAGRGYGWAENPWVWVVRFEVASTTGRAGVSL